MNVPEKIFDGVQTAVASVVSAHSVGTYSYSTVHRSQVQSVIMLGRQDNIVLKNETISSIMLLFALTYRRRIYMVDAV